MIQARIAPTPSGYLHLGNGLSFIYTWLLCRKQGGKLRLRIDDLDADRARDSYLEDIFKTLEWLGLEWDLGPIGVEDFKQHHSQHLRKDRYEGVLKQLELENAVFACTCSRAQIRAVSPSGVYPGTCHPKKLPLDTPQAVWRIKVGDLGEVEEFIVRKKDKWPSYHLASVIDDEDYGINLIVRGEDLVESTACQRYLATTIKASNFTAATIIHHPLIGTKEHKLSKSAGATSLMAMKEAGYQPAHIYRMLAYWLHMPTQEIGTLPELLDAFSIVYLPPKSMSFEELTAVR